MKVIDLVKKGDDQRTMLVAEVANEVIKYLNSLGNASLKPDGIGNVQCTVETTNFVFNTLQVQVCYLDEKGNQQTATATILGFINLPNS